LDQFNCSDIGFTSNDVGCKIEMRPQDKTLKSTRQVLISDAGQKRKVLLVSLDKNFNRMTKLTLMQRKNIKLEMAKLLYLTQWSRPDIGNAVRELTRFVSKPQIIHLKAMKQVMDYCSQKKLPRI
jgi:hypothetical protein